MAQTSEPGQAGQQQAQAMTAERLAWILERIATIPAGRDHTFVSVADLQMLRAELDRLHAALAAAEARRAALVARQEQMRGVVEIMAKGPLSWNPEFGDICACCDRAWMDGDPDDDQPGAIQHTSDCAVVLARALLASLPAGEGKE